MNPHEHRAAGPQGEVSLLLPYRPPYDWPAMLGFLAARAIPGMESVDGAVYTRSLAIDELHGTVSVAHAAEQQALRVTIRCPNLTALPMITARLRRVFDLAADPAVIAAQLSSCPLMAALTRARPGLRVPGAWDGFELAMRAVLGQQITVAAAVKLAAKLVEQYGEPLKHLTPNHPGLRRVFPAPERLAGAALKTLGMPATRAATLAGVASALIANPQLLDAAASLDEGLGKLRALPGIGDWTAQYIAIRQMREPDAFPAGDVGLMQALQRLEGSRPSARQLSERSQAWRPWRAYAAQHLWQSLIPV